MPITQTTANKGGLSQVFQDTADTVPVRGTDFLGVNFFAGSGNPNGLCTAALGSIYLEVALGALYINVDGATKWVPMPGVLPLTQAQFIYAHNLTEAPTVAGQVVTIEYNHTNGLCFNANATTTFPIRTGVTPAVIAAGVPGLVQVAGTCEALVSGDAVDVAAGDFLEICDGVTAFVKDGAARTTLSAAVAVDANADVAALKTVVLIPEQHTIAAS